MVPYVQSDDLNSHREIRHIFDVSRDVKVRLVREIYKTKKTVEEVIDLSNEMNVA
jgi:hypothetical protein